MAVIKCKMCGGDLNIIQGVSTAECDIAEASRPFLIWTMTRNWFSLSVRSACASSANLTRPPVSMRPS